MKCKILHEIPGRMRIRCLQSRMTLRQADILEYYLRAAEGVTDVKVYDRTCDAVIYFSSDRGAILRALAAFSYSDPKAEALVPDHTGRELNRIYEDKLASLVLRRMLRRIFLPRPLRIIWNVIHSFGYIANGIRTLIQGRLEVAVLDAAAISVSLLRRDFDTASSVMFLLKVGELLEEWTHRKSVADLARSMALNVDNVWLRAGGADVLVSVSSIAAGDCIVVRTGNMIPLDGRVVEGDAMVNQASITGESMPVHKECGSYAYAGTVIEEGECVICVEKASGSGRYDKVVKMIEESEKLKSSTEDRASHLADRLVPISLGGTILTYLLTRNVTKALSILMVDFSCALKLSMPLTVLSAMREAGGYKLSVKGGRFLEAVAEAETVVFDKTGTLTHAEPRVAKIITFGGRSEEEMLRLAACLEEHYPHSMANAVVAAARERGLKHEERHSKVEYVVAHGISSIVDGEKVIIGSQHFVFQDENASIPANEMQLFDSLPEQYSHLFLAISGELAAVICVEDPLRSEAPEVISSLRAAGIRKIVMMTGDNEKTARAIAAAVGVDEYHSEVLPEDKAAFIRAEREAGRKVIMIGDGVNDSPALSSADVGIAISDGAAIAREISDITIASDDLRSLVTLRQLSSALMARINMNYRFIIAFNSMLIALGISGILPPATSAMLHNLSTLGISLHGMTDLLR